MQPQTLQIALVISLCAVIVCVYFIIVLRRERDKYLFKLKPIETEKNRLIDEVNRLKIKADEPVTLPDGNKAASEKKNDKKNNKKSNKSAANANTFELSEKIQLLESEVTKLKQQNYDLSQNNKSLLRDIKENSKADQNEQREVIALRESESELRANLETAQSRITELEKQLAQNQTPASPSQPENTAASDENSEKLESLTRENASLQASLRDARNELSAYKRDFRSEVDAAKKEVTNSNQALRREAADAVRQMQQSKKRADNNHKLYLIARAQTLLAQKKLAVLDPSFKPAVSLPVRNDAINEIVKKIAAFDAREKRASEEVVSLNEKITSLENENANLKSQIEQAPGSDSLASAFGLKDDSLSDLVKEFSEHTSVVVSAAPNVMDLPADANNAKQPESASLTDLALPGIDDDWDAL